MPGDDMPGLDFPGSPTREDVHTEVRTHSTADIPVDATGTTALGTVEEDEGEVLEVRVNATAADFDFNVNADGVALFSAAQSPGGTSEETFTPDTDAATFENGGPALDFEVLTASGTAGATADVDADVEVVYR